MSRRLAAVLPLLLLLSWALFVFAPLVADPDLWGHVRFGQDALRTGHIIRPDTYSYLTAGQEWVNHEWLTEAAYGVAYNLAGAAGLIALNLLLCLAIVALLYNSLVRCEMERTGAALLTGVVCLVLRPGVLTVRPQVFSYLLFLLLLRHLDGYARRTESAGGPEGSQGLKFVAGTWVLIAVWVNMHGAVLAGLAVLGIWSAAHLIDVVIRARSLRIFARPAARPVIFGLVLAPTALLLNPWGAKLIGFLLRTATVSRPEILEWQGARLSNLWSLYWLGLLILTLVAVVLSRQPRRLSRLAPLLVVALMPLSAIRHIPLFAVAAPVLAASDFADGWARLTHRVRPPARLAAFVSRVASPLGALLSVGLVIAAATQLRGIAIEPAAAAFPVRAVALLKASGAQGNLATEFNWGEYVIWHLGPQLQVSVDGRRETVYSDAVYGENLDFMLGRGAWDRLVDRAETDLALVDRERPVYTLMRGKAAWTLAYEDEAAALFVRSGRPLRLDLAQAPVAWPANGAGLTFPVE